MDITLIILVLIALAVAHKYGILNILGLTTETGTEIVEGNLQVIREKNRFKVDTELGKINEKWKTTDKPVATQKMIKETREATLKRYGITE